MRLTHFLAAGLLFAGIGVSTEASAQRHDGYGQQQRGDRDGRYDRRDDRRWDRGDHRRWDRRNNGRHNGWRNNRNRDCRIVWRHHQRVRVCR